MLKKILHPLFAVLCEVFYFWSWLIYVNHDLM